MRNHDVYGIEHGIDFDGRYTVKGMEGVAFHLAGWSLLPPEQSYFCTACYSDSDECVCDDPQLVEDQELEWSTNFSMVRAIMVGDDVEHLVDVMDLVIIDRDSYCAGCGQTGVSHYIEA